jgi:hypothetical protein
VYMVLAYMWLLVVIAVFYSSRLPTSNFTLDNNHYVFVNLFYFSIRNSYVNNVSSCPTCSTGFFPTNKIS